jgi:non-specific serine/threonine protein kinase
LTLTAANAEAVAQICDRLYGLPLAIELAAARAGTLPVAGIAARLDDRFRLLTGGPRTALPRQQTLRGTLDWSYDLLDEPERVLLRRLAVFAGGWTLRAAEAVCAGEGLAAWEVLDLLGGLADKSLVVLEEHEDIGRYRMLEVIREYAHEQFEAAGETTPVRNRHAAWCLAMLEEAGPALSTAQYGTCLDRLDREQSNLRVALQWSLRAGENLGAAARMADVLYAYWILRGNLQEGSRWLTELRARTSQAPATQRVLTLHALAELLYNGGDFDQACAALDECIDLCRRLGDKQRLALTLFRRGVIARWQADHAQASVLLEESLALFQELGDVSSATFALISLARGRRDRSLARALLAESVALTSALDDDYGRAKLLHLLGIAFREQGDYVQARMFFEQALGRSRQLRDYRGVAIALRHLGRVARDLNDHAQAGAWYKQSLLAWRQHGHVGGMATALEGLALVRAAEGQASRAAQLLGAAATLRTISGLSVFPSERAAHAQAIASIREACGEDTFVAAWAAGQVMPLEEAVALALEGHAEASGGG